jgi:hypothetical protein
MAIVTRVIWVDAKLIKEGLPSGKRSEGKGGTAYGI